MLRGQRRPGQRWTPTDSALAVALQAYEDDCCPGCGTPRTYGMDPDAAGHFHAQTATCYGCAALDRENERRGDKPAPPGQRQYVAPDQVLEHAMTYPIHVAPIHT